MQTEGTVRTGILMSTLVVVLAGGCGDSDANTTDAGTPDSVTVIVGAEGGTVDLPSGAGVEIPPGALGEATTITVSEADSGFVALPAVASGKVFSFEPHGLEFLAPVTVTIPHDGQPAEFAMYTSSPGVDWDKLAAEPSPTALRVQVTHFSFFFNGREVCGLYRQECCEASDGGDGACAGDALHCSDGRCLECGLEYESCCGGVGGMCRVAGQSCYDGYCSYPLPDAGPSGDAAVPLPPDAAPPPDAMELPAGDAMPPPPVDAMEPPPADAAPLLGDAG